MKKEFKKYDIPKFNNFRDVLERGATNGGDKPAFLYREKKEIKKVSYKQFRDDTLYLGNALFDMGFSGAHVACIGENSYRWLTVYMTMLNSNGVFVPVDRLLPEDDIVTVLNHSETEVLFFSEKFEKTINNIKERLEFVKQFICLGKSEDYLTYDNVIASGKKLCESGFHKYEEAKGDTNALRVLVYTSGTTGMPKGVMLSEHNIVSCIYNGMKISRLYDRAISLLPYNHSYEMCGILAGLNNHTSVFINDSIRGIMKNFADFKPESAYLVPSFLEVFYKRINHQLGDKKPLVERLIKVSNALRKVGIDMRRVFFGQILKAFGGEMKKVVSGGAPIRPEIAEFFDSIGINVVNGYGITECAPLVSVTRDNFEDCSTSGVPIDCISVKIENADENGIGEICVKGDSVMLGYYKNKEETDKVIRDGWFHTGDLGTIDGEGRIVVTGRSKNLIVLKNGKNIFPEEIEGYIMSIPYVKEAVVTSYKNAEGLEIGLCAYVYPDEESGCTEEMLRGDIDRACSSLPKYKNVTKIVIRDKEFEKTTSNKIRRNRIESDITANA